MNLGNAYYMLGDIGKSRDVLERALSINERAYGRDHPEVAITLVNLGNACYSLGDYAKQRCLRGARALAIKERAYGRDHPEVALTLNNLGGAHNQFGDYAKARRRAGARVTTGRDRGARPTAATIRTCSGPRSGGRRTSGTRMAT